MSADGHRDFNDVLLKGTLASKGMGNYSGLLSLDEVEAIHSYLIDLAWQAYEAAQAAAQSGQPAAPHTPKTDNDP